MRSRKRRISAKEFYNRMKEISNESNKAFAHIHADCLMCEVLQKLGYNDGVAVFNGMGVRY